jgi:UDP-N-acetylmuramyl pentapeptide synthase
VTERRAPGSKGWCVEETLGRLETHQAWARFQKKCLARHGAVNALAASFAPLHLAEEIERLALGVQFLMPQNTERFFADRAEGVAKLRELADRAESQREWK